MPLRANSEDRTLSMTSVRTWLRRKWWAWKLRDLELPYPEPRNEHEEGMNMVVVMGAMGRPPMSGRADW